MTFSPNWSMLLGSYSTCNLIVDASYQGKASGTGTLLLIMERLRSFLIAPHSRLAMEGRSMKTQVRIVSSFRFPLTVSSHPRRSIRGLAVVLATSVLLVAAPLSACGGSSASIELRTEALVMVNARSALGQLPTTAFGVGAVVWDDHLLDDNFPGLLSAAGVKVLRYPGGSASDAYRWQSNTMVSGQDYHANPSNTFDAFMGVVQATGAQTMITINYGSGTPQEAAGWVQYANKGGPGYTGPVPTYAGGSSTGHTYGVTYWEIGNEIYGNGTYGDPWEYDVHAKSPTTYARQVVAYSQAMKAVDLASRWVSYSPRRVPGPMGRPAPRRRSPGTPRSYRLPAPPSTS